MFIERITTSNEEIYLAFQRLIPQLTAKRPPPSRNDIEILVTSPTSVVLVARKPDKNGKIIATATLNIYRVPTGIHAHLDDVIVDKESRGLGVGEALTIEALRLAKESGADGVALTSHPRRKAANHLYQKIGFKSWMTNLYFFKFNQQEKR